MILPTGQPSRRSHTAQRPSLVHGHDTYRKRAKGLLPPLAYMSIEEAAKAANIP